MCSFGELRKRSNLSGIAASVFHNSVNQLYVADKFCRMQVPHLGPQISQVSRHYFHSLAVAAMALISSYYWASFPFDNLCQSDGVA
ncbi:hypothetical protein ACA910_013006 [Epithemia clementina (nom. ined.)]